MEKFGQYILIHKVGTGGMAELFKAKKIGIEGFERILAIKRILPHLSSDEGFISMFIAEAKLAARLNHKNIAQIYDFGKTDQSYYIALEYIRGKDLKSILRKCREKKVRLPRELAIFIAKEVASALHSAHNQKDKVGENLNIIHRDVSPPNILISYDGEVKVVDFGIAKAGTQSKTLTGVLKGKLSYMSPEQAWGKPVDHRSDIFSLGSVLYEMLINEKLFSGNSELDTLEKVREANVALLLSSRKADITPAMEKKLLRALEKDVEYRYQNAFEMENELGQVLFEELHVEPAASLKKFMHGLFEREIEAELRSDIEEATVITQFDEAPHAAVSQTETAAESPAPDTSGTRKWEIVPYAIAISIALIAIVGSFLAYPLLRKQPTEQSPDTGPIRSQAAIPAPANVPGPAPQESKPEALPAAGPEVRTQAAPKAVTKADAEARPQAKARTKTAKRVSESAAGKGSISIQAIPKGNVYIDGKGHGATPQTVDNLRPGRHKVKLITRGFTPWETTVTVSKGERAQVSHKFEGFGMLAVNASPWGEVYLDGKYKGSTPLTIDKVPAGRHQLRVSKEGFSSFSSTVDIKEGETEKVSASLKRE